MSRVKNLQSIQGMGGKHFLLWFLFFYNIGIISPLLPNDFEKTKAEDITDNLPLDHLTPNLMASCDMTFGFCDINCCSDKDCSEQDKRSFSCSDMEQNEPSKFKHLECGNLSSIETVGNPLLCLQRQNSPYLGDFYLDNENFSDHSFSQILAFRNRGISSFRITDLLNNIPDYKYEYGSNMFFHDTKGRKQYIKVSSNIINKGNGYCSKLPLKFLISKESYCFHLMNEEQCLLNKEFHLQHHINVLSRIEYLGSINNVNVTYNIVCLRDGTYTVLFSKNMLKTTKEKLLVLEEVIKCKNDLFTVKNQALCENVVVGLNYTITVNGTLLRSINVTIFTANVPLSVRGFIPLHQNIFNPLNTLKKEVMYALQKITVTFKNVDSTYIDAKLGYAIGQPVQAGYYYS